MSQGSQFSIFADLGILPEGILRLAGRERSRLLGFLLRWEHLNALHACLDALIPVNPTLVSLLDLRARAFLAQERYDDAVATMEERLQIRSSMSARALVARITLARGDVEDAHQRAQALVDEQPDSVTAWQLLGDVALAQGQLDAALVAYRRLSELRPQGRTYLACMTSYYEARGDRVTASGYAVRLLRTGDAENPLTATHLRRLRDYFQASGEGIRAADLEAELARRYAGELAELQAMFAPLAEVKPISVPAPAAAEEEGLAPPEPLPTFDQVDVSEEERARVMEAAQRVFGFEHLLPGQLETIACVLRGEDVLTILPTGGGKSLCYQLPAMLAERGTTLVISPLIALMKDQVDSLPAGVRGRATTINSSLERGALRQRLQQIAEGGYRLVYAAPERLRQPSFLHALRRAGVYRLVIDEAHCVSVWGHDFRPDYLTIGQARQALGHPPLLAMTATAPSRVRSEILRNLATPAPGPGDGMRVIAGDVTRPNLRLEVFYARNQDEKLRHLLAFCQSEPGSGIIYAGTRARCEELAALLRRYDVVASHYHAGIADRDRVQDDFMTGRVRVVVATIAFGLGIDKPDIRFIVHFAPSQSVEAYYQEAGRAGRDGLPARCLLMYATSDRATLTRRTRRDDLPVEFLRSVYGAVKRRLEGTLVGRVAAADLERDLQADRTRIRVGLSLLEEVGLLRRGPDFPRSAIVCLTVAGGDDSLPEEMRAFCQVARLRPGQSLTLDLADVARQAGLALAEVERQVLAWVDAGWLSYTAAGRDLLLELPAPPADAAQRIEMLLERYATIQIQRVDEVAAYAGTRQCRHGHLNAYLGGRTIERCNACDNCVVVPSLSDQNLPGEREQLLVILRCVSTAPWSWGRRSLTRILRGEARADYGGQSLHTRACESEVFGVLAFRSRAAIEHMLDRLEKGGFLQARHLEHGGVVLDITGAGKAALQGPSALDGLVEPAKKPLSPPTPLRGSPKGATPTSEVELDVDDALFEKLRSWRLEQAHAQDVPPYIVFHDSHLRAIVAQRPLTLDALSGVKGVGPRKLERYGEAVIGLVDEHLKGELRTKEELTQRRKVRKENADGKTG